jgi:serine/threonine-protein kinase
MGRVLLAHDELLERDVAIKLFLSSLLVGEASHRRFVAEARAMAKVRHENVVSIFDLGETRQGPYFVMEYIPGPSLQRWLEEAGLLAIDEALGIFAQICRGVDAIHKAGAIHNDLKPGNVLVGPGHRVAVTDLGLSLLLRSPKTGSRVTTDVAGTPWYMAPELIVEEKLSRELATRVDIYALGVIACELLTGRRPFEGSSVLEILQQHVRKEPPRASDLRPDLPAGFDEPIAAALAKAPQDRPASALRLLEAFQAHRQRAAAPQLAAQVLVADDDLVFLEYVAALLRQSFPQISLLCVTDGAAALAALDREPMALAILDLDMPQLNAIELAAALEESRQRPRIVVVTATGGEAEWKVLARMHTDAFLVKPVEPKVLVELVSRLLSGEA